MLSPYSRRPQNDFPSTSGHTPLPRKSFIPPPTPSAGLFLATPKPPTYGSPYSSSLSPLSPGVTSRFGFTPPSTTTPRLGWSGTSSNRVSLYRPTSATTATTGRKLSHRLNPRPAARRQQVSLSLVDPPAPHRSVLRNFAPPVLTVPRLLGAKYADDSGVGLGVKGSPKVVSETRRDEVPGNLLETSGIPRLPRSPGFLGSRPPINEPQYEQPLRGANTSTITSFNGVKTTRQRHLPLPPPAPARPVQSAILPKSPRITCAPPPPSGTTIPASPLSSHLFPLDYTALPLHDVVDVDRGWVGQKPVSVIQGPSTRAVTTADANAHARCSSPPRPLPVPAPRTAEWNGQTGGGENAAQRIISTNAVHYSNLTTPLVPQPIVIGLRTTTAPHDYASSSNIIARRPLPVPLPPVPLPLPGVPLLSTCEAAQTIQSTGWFSTSTYNMEVDGTGSPPPCNIPYPLSDTVSATPHLLAQPGQHLQSSSTFYCRSMNARHARKQGSRPVSFPIAAIDTGALSQTRPNSSMGRAISSRPRGPRPSSGSRQPISRTMQPEASGSNYSQASSSGSQDVQPPRQPQPESGVALSRRAAVLRHSGDTMIPHAIRPYSMIDNKAHRASLAAMLSPPIDLHSERIIESGYLHDSPPTQSDSGSRGDGVLPEQEQEQEMTLQWEPDTAGREEQDSARDAWLRMEQSLGRRVNSALDFERGRWVMRPSPVAPVEVPAIESSPVGKVRSPGEFTISDYLDMGSIDRTPRATTSLRRSPASSRRSDTSTRQPSKRSSRQSLPPIDTTMATTSGEDMTRGSTMDWAVYAPSCRGSAVNEESPSLVNYHMDDALFPFAPEDDSREGALTIMREKTRKNRHSVVDGSVGKQRGGPGLRRLDTQIAHALRSFKEPESASDSPESDVAGKNEEDETRGRRPLRTGTFARWRKTTRSQSRPRPRPRPVEWSDREPINLDTPVLPDSPPTPIVITPPTVTRALPQISIVDQGLGLGVPINLTSTYSLYNRPSGLTVGGNGTKLAQFPSPQPRSPRPWSVLPGLEDLSPMDDDAQLLLVRDLDTGRACEIAMSRVEETLATLGRT